MLGMLRFLLAYLVVLSHLVGSEYMSHFGFYAVRGFFVISGFIMTLTLNETYAFDGARFWANRALRLLPPFYLVSLATLAAVFILPQQAADFLKFWARAVARRHPAQSFGAAAATAGRVVSDGAAVLVGRGRDRHVRAALFRHRAAHGVGGIRARGRHRLSTGM